MHELSVAIELVELATAEARRLGDVRVAALHLRLGPLSGVAVDALLFAFDVATAGTTIEGARLEIERELVLAWCGTCAQSVPLTTIQQRRCPVCDRPTPHLTAGAALELTALEIVEHVRADR